MSHRLPRAITLHEFGHGTTVLAFNRDQAKRADKQILVFRDYQTQIEDGIRQQNYNPKKPYEHVVPRTPCLGSCSGLETPKVIEQLLDLLNGGAFQNVAYPRPPWWYMRRRGPRSLKRKGYPVPLFQYVKLGMQGDLQKAHQILDTHLESPLPLGFMNHFIGRQGAGFKALINPCTYSLYPFTPFFSKLEALAQTFLTPNVKDVLRKTIRSTTVQGYEEHHIVKVTDDTLPKKRQYIFPSLQK
jgi:hypothetical protein